MTCFPFVAWCIFMKVWLEDGVWSLNFVVHVWLVWFILSNNIWHSIWKRANDPALQCNVYSMNFSYVVVVIISQFNMSDGIITFAIPCSHSFIFYHQISRLLLYAQLYRFMWARFYFKSVPAKNCMKCCETGKCEKKKHHFHSYYLCIWLSQRKRHYCKSRY